MGGVWEMAPGALFLLAVLSVSANVAVGTFMAGSSDTSLCWALGCLGLSHNPGRCDCACQATVPHAAQPGLLAWCWDTRQWTVSRCHPAGAPRTPGSRTPDPRWIFKLTRQSARLCSCFAESVADTCPPWMPVLSRSGYGLCVFTSAFLFSEHELAHSDLHSNTQ